MERRRANVVAQLPQAITWTARSKQSWKFYLSKFNFFFLFFLLRASEDMYKK